MPRSASDTRALLENLPVESATGNAVSVNLVFDSVFRPIDLFDALETKFGSVTLEHDSVRTHGPFNFRVS